MRWYVTLKSNYFVEVMFRFCRTVTSAVVLT